MRSSPVASCSGRQPAAASPLGRRRLQARPFHDVACCSTSSEASEAPVATGRLSARERLEALKRAQQDSDAIIDRTIRVAAPLEKVDRRMYEQVEASRNALSSQLSDARRCISALQSRLDASDEAMIAAAEALRYVAFEVTEAGRLAQAASQLAGVRSKTEEALSKFQTVASVIQTVESVLEEQRAVLDASVPRKLPIQWVGSASEVRVMGNFDGWTMGVELSAADIPDDASDSVFGTFQGELSLLPGTYRIKFLVDGEWRPARDWPTDIDELGETVNVVTVA